MKLRTGCCLAWGRAPLMGEVAAVLVAAAVVVDGVELDLGGVAAETAQGEALALARFDQVGRFDLVALAAADQLHAAQGYAVGRGVADLEAGLAALVQQAPLQGL